MKRPLRHRTALRYWLIFVLVLGAFHASFTTGERLWRAIDRGTASTLALSLSFLGFRAQADGSVVKSSLGSVEIIRECTTVYPSAILIAAVVAYPLSWRTRLLGVAIGIPALVIVNQLRLASLCYISSRYPSSFETAHLLVWPPLIILLTVLWLVGWIAIGSRLDAARLREPEGHPQRLDE